jgi:hypothetical protein
MAQIKCPKCKRNFSSNNTESLVTRGAAAAAGAGTGAWFGAEIGIVGGPATGIAGTIPGAVHRHIVVKSCCRVVAVLTPLNAVCGDGGCPADCGAAKTDYGGCRTLPFSRLWYGEFHTQSVTRRFAVDHITP